MADALIENPILNSPFGEPTRHWRFTTTASRTRSSRDAGRASYFMPIARPKKGDGQLEFETEWTARPDRGERAHQPDPRARRACGAAAAGPASRRSPASCSSYWTDPDRERRLFFCQIEARRDGDLPRRGRQQAAHQDAWIVNALRETADDANPGLFRVALKMATGTGKTVVMAMLIAWQTLNKAASPQDARFTDAFLVVTPGITIRDRLRVLLPERPGQLLPRARPGPARRARPARRRRKIVITNFHAFQLRDRAKASKTTKQLLAGRRARTRSTRRPDQMVPAGAAAALGTKQGRSSSSTTRRTTATATESARRCRRLSKVADAPTRQAGGQGARRAGPRLVQRPRGRQRKIGIKTVYDLSATPFYLAAPATPRAPLPLGGQRLLADRRDRVRHREGPARAGRRRRRSTDRPDLSANLWVHIRDELPKKSVRQQDLAGRAEAARPSSRARCTASTATTRRRSARGRRARPSTTLGETPPVFIVVCTNTSVSKLVFDWIAGWEKSSSTTTADACSCPASCRCFQQRRRTARWIDAARTRSSSTPRSSSPARR